MDKKVGKIEYVYTLRVGGEPYTVTLTSEGETVRDRWSWKANTYRRVEVGEGKFKGMMTLDEAAAVADEAVRTYLSARDHDYNEDGALTLWDSERFAVLKVVEGTSAGMLKVVHLDTGLVDWPVRYGDGSVAFDYPERLPHYAQEAVRVAYQPEGALREIKLQLCLMRAFTEETVGADDPKKLFWVDNLPYFMSDYTPDEWQAASNWPIWKSWDDFKGELAARGMDERLAQAEELPVADLIAASEAGMDWGE